MDVAAKSFCTWYNNNCNTAHNSSQLWDVCEMVVVDDRAAFYIRNSCT